MLLESLKKGDLATTSSGYYILEMIIKLKNS